MQSKNSITVVHVMAGMCGMYKLCVLFGMETLKWSMLCILNTYLLLICTWRLWDTCSSFRDQINRGKMKREREDLK